MYLHIHQAGSPVLATAARALGVEEIRSEQTQQLIAMMRETMRNAPGVGLAAPQVGADLQLAVIEDREEFIRALPPGEPELRERVPVPFHVIINPTLEPIGDERASFFEGCLSLDSFVAIVPRYRAVRVHYLDSTGKENVTEATGWYARILQHEIDHLRGIQYTERMYPRSLMTSTNYARFWKAKSVDIVLRDLAEPTHQ